MHLWIWGLALVFLFCSYGGFPWLGFLSFYFKAEIYCLWFWLCVFVCSLCGYMFRCARHFLKQPKCYFTKLSFHDLCKSYVNYICIARAVKRIYIYVVFFLVFATELATRAFKTDDALLVSSVLKALVGVLVFVFIGFCILLRGACCMSNCMPNHTNKSL
jgi:hypothetical protein